MGSAAWPGHCADSCEQVLAAPPQLVQKQQLEEWLATLRTHTAKHISNVALGLELHTDLCPVGVLVASLRPSVLEIGQHFVCNQVRVQRVTRRAAKLQLHSRSQWPRCRKASPGRCPEEAVQGLGMGPGSPILIGCGQLCQQPEVGLPYHWRHWLLPPDAWGELEYGECYIISGGRLSAENLLFGVTP